MAKSPGLANTNLLLRPPQAPTLAKPVQNADGPQQTKKFTWNGRFSFGQENATANIRDRFALLMVKMQRLDSRVQLLPYEETSTENPITVPKNIPYDDSLSHFLQYPEKQNERAKFIQVYARFTSTIPPSTLKKKLLSYLKEQFIYMQKNDVPSSNLVLSGWIFQQHPDHVNGMNLKKRMTEQLNGVQEFQLNVRNGFRPIPSLAATTRTWIVEMDKDFHAAHFGQFLEKFHSENNIVIVPCHGYNTWDSDYSSTKQLLSQQNTYLRETTAIPLDNLQNIDVPIIIGEDTVTFADYFKLLLNTTDEAYVLDVCQYNSSRVNIITKHCNVNQLEEKIDIVLDQLQDHLSPANKTTLFPTGRLPLRNGRDTTLPATINFYKSKLSTSLNKSWVNVASGDTASTADSTVMTLEKPKYADMESKISELSDSHASVLSDFKNLSTQHDQLTKSMTDQIKDLLQQLTKLSSTLYQHNKEIQDQQEKVTAQVTKSLQQQKSMQEAQKVQVDQITAATEEKLNAALVEQTEQLALHKAEVYNEMDIKLNNQFEAQMINIDKVIQNFRQSLITEITKPPRSPPTLSPPPPTRRKFNATAEGLFLLENAMDEEKSPPGSDNADTASVNPHSSFPLSSQHSKTSQLSHIHLKQNHIIHEEFHRPIDGTIRVYHQNIGGLEYNGTEIDLEPIKELINDYELSICGLSEINVDTTKAFIRRSLHNQVRQSSDQKLSYSTSTVTAKNIYKSGGVLQMATGNINRRYVQNITDPLGRWTGQGFVGEEGQMVYFFTLYVPCKKKQNTTGSTTAYAQQEQLLRMRDGKYKEPRKQFYIDLTKVFASLQFSQRTQLESKFVIVGDFNSKIEEDPDLLSFCRRFKLIDILFKAYGSRDFSTYTRGTTRIDFALLSDPLTDSLLSGGYTTFGKLLPSDHRGLHLIMDSKKALGYLPDKISRIQFRKLRSNNRVLSIKYLQRLHKSLLSQNFYKRIDDLFLSKHPDHEEAERLDSSILQLSLSAEDKLPNKFQYDFSVALLEAKAKVRVRKLQRSQLLTGIDYSTEISEIMEQYAMDDIDMPKDKTEAWHFYSQSVKKVKESQKDHKKLRSEFLEDLISKISAEKDAVSKKRVKSLKAIKATEKLIRVFQDIKSQRPTGLRQQINQILVPCDATDNPKDIEKQPEKWKLLLTQEEILTALLHRNIGHFGKAHGSPFTCDPLEDIFGYTASGDFLSEVRQRQEELQHLHPSTKDYLDQLQMTARDPIIKEFLNVASVRNKFRKWRESTSTSPSGLHLGHWRVLCMDYELGEDTEEDNEIKNIQDLILTCRVKLLNYAIRWNYSFRRWHKIVTLMILKEKGNIMIHRMRMLHLYEADLGALLAIKWRALTFELFQRQHLHEGLFGSVPSKTCHDPVLLSELQYEISRFTRKSYAEGKGDAAGCYDNILPTLTSATSQTEGMPRTVCILHAKTLKQAKYYLKVMFGVSEKYYQHGTFTPIYGNGQGSTNSPSAWLYISNIIFKCHCRKATGASYTDPENNKTVHLYLAGFVDDINLYANYFLSSEISATALIEQLKDDIQLFSSLLWTTGGQLEPRKCNYTLMSWKFKEDGTPYLDESLYSSIDITDINNEVCSTIKYVPPTIASKYLGHLKEPSGNQQKQAQKLQDIIATEKVFVATSQLPSDLMYTYYTTIFLKKVGYPLTLSYFSKKKLRKLQDGYYKILLNSLGFNQNTAKQVRYGSPSYAGIGLRCLYLDQGSSSVLQFLRHWRSNNNISNLLRITVAWCQFSLGTGISFLRDMNRNLPHFEGNFLKGIRSFLRHINGYIILDESYVPELQRENDIHLMDIVIDSGKFSNRQVHLINYCRLYLSVHTLSDITKANGKWLHMEFLQGNVDRQSPSSRQLRVIQQKPGPTTWKLWKRANKLWATKNGKLYSPLGNWLVPVNKQRMERFAYRDPKNGCIYMYNGRQFKKFDLLLHKLLHLPPNQQRFFDQIPEDVLPNDIRASPWYSMRMDQQVFPVIQRAPSQTTPSTFEEYVLQLPKWEQLLLQNVKWFIQEDEAREILSTNCLLIGTDGSAKNNIGAFSWIISTSTGLRCVSNTGNSPGKDQYSFRAESHAILSVHLFYKHTALFFECELDETINIYTDSASFISKYQKQFHIMQKSPSVRSYVSPEWDIFQELISLDTTTAFHLKLNHVKSHQDKKTAYEQLALPVQLNIQADKLAEEQRLKASGNRLSCLYPSTKAHLIINEETITKSYNHNITKQYQQREMISYYIHRYKWTSQIFYSIRWYELGMAVRHLRHGAFFIKWAQGLLPTRFFINKYNNNETPLCPACKCSVETNEHILQCPMYSDWKKIFLTTLEKHFHSTSTPHHISSPLLSIIHSYLNNNIHNNNLQHRDMFAMQTSIGWKNFFRGQISKEFQNAYETDANHQEYWTFKLIRLIWRQIQDLWEVRNSYEHGVSDVQTTHNRRRKMLNELKKIYNEKQHVLAADREIFHETAEEHLELHPQLSQVQTWMNMTRKTIEASKEKAKAIALHGVQRLSRYFHVQHSSNQHRQQRRRRKPKEKSVSSYRQHQTYLRFSPDSALIVNRLPEQVTHQLTPRQIQPQIPWERPKFRQQKLSNYM